MDLFTYLMAKKGHNTGKDLFSYLLGKKASGGSGTYTTFSGTSLNISNTLQAKIKNIALEGNTSQDGTPTPDTPIPIKVVTGEQNVEISGKNLIPTQVNAWEQGSITVDGNVSSLTRIRTKNYYPIKNDVTYHVSVENEDYCFLNIWLYDKDNNYIGQYFNINKSINGSTNLNIIIPSTIITNLSYMRVVLRKQNNTSQININEIEVIKPQMELGTTKTSYEPYYTPQTYPLSLGNIELAKIENYKDYIYKQNDNWYLHKEIGKAILNGTENWNYVSGNHPRFTIPKSDIALQNFNVGAPNVAISDYFKASNWYSIYSFDSVDNAICSHNSAHVINIKSTQFTNLDDFKTWLSRNNTTVYYVMENSIDTQITDTTLISQLENINNNARSYKDTTIIECTSESTDNEVIGFSGDIKVTSVSLGNSLNTSLLSSNIQEEPNLDDVNEIEEQNDEPIKEKIEEQIEEEVS